MRRNSPNPNYCSDRIQVERAIRIPNGCPTFKLIRALRPVLFSLLEDHSQELEKMRQFELC